MRIAAFMLACGLVAGLTGCDGDAPRPAWGDEANPFASPSNHPREDVTFLELPNSRGQEAQALAVYLDYLVAFVASQRKATLAPEMAGLASPEGLEMLVRSLDIQQEHGIRYGGSTTIAVTIAEASSRKAVFDTCIDGTQRTLIQNGKTQRPSPPLRVPIRARLNKVTFGWVVTRVAQSGDTC